MKYFQTFAALLLLGAVSVAQSKTIDLGTLNDGITGFGNNNIDPGASFGDQFNFGLNGSADLFGAVGSRFITDFAVQLQRQVASGWETVGSTFTSDFSFSGLSSGLYRFDVSGQAFLNNSNATYGGLAIVAAVPEADTWLMLLIGSGLIAYQLRRKQRSLPAQALTAA